MTTREQRIHKQREYFQTKLRKQMDELMFASIEQDAEKHASLLQAVETTTIILWRFDGKLKLERASATAN